MQPKDKSDSKWLRDAGYRGMPEFMASYGLKDPEDWDDAKKILAKLRDEQQREWEAKQRPGTTTSSKEIAEAILWHQRMGHLNYHELKMLSAAATGCPDFKFNVDDIPVCESCTAAGVKDR